MDQDKKCPYMMLGDFRQVTKDLPDTLWLCVPGGPAWSVIVERGANEPFVLILNEKTLKEVNQNHQEEVDKLVDDL